MKKKYTTTYKGLCLILIMVTSILMLSACTKEKSNITVTYKDIVEANTSTAQLDGHDSISFTVLSGENLSPLYDIYLDKTTLATDSKDSQFIYTPEVQGSLENGVFSPYLNLSEDSLYEYLHKYFLLDPAGNEEVTDTVKNGDKLLITTEFSGEESKAIIENIMGSFVEGDYLSYEYLVDETSYKLHSYKAFLMREGQDPKVVEEVKGFIYDEKAPAYLKEALELASKPMKEESPDKLRTVSVIMDPNTASEKTFSITVPKGAGVYFNLREGYNTLYKDRECTELYEWGSADKNQDLTLYSPPDKK